MKRLSLIRHLSVQTSNTSLGSIRLSCSDGHEGSSDSQEFAATVDSLIAIFTKKRPTKTDSEELQFLAPLITPKVVESALKQMKSWNIAWGFFDWASKQCGYSHNCYTYNAMAAILQRARRNAQMKVLAENVVRSRCEMTPGALGYFIRCLGNLGMVEEANSMFDQVRQLELCSLNGYSYNCLLEAIAKSDKVELAEMRVKEMSDSGWKLDRFTLTPLLQIYCNNGVYDKTINVFHKMNDLNCVDAHAVSILAMFFCKSGQIDKVLELIETMEARNIRLNEKTFCILIHGFVIESRVDKAVELFNKMKQYGFSPNIEQYDVLIGGLCLNKELDKALNLFLEMKDHGVAPDVRLLEKAVSFFSEEEVIRLLDDLPEGKDSKSATLRFNFSLSYYTKNGMVDKAYQILRTTVYDSTENDEVGKLIKNKGTLLADSTSFRIVINGFLQAGKLDMALTLFQEMCQIGLSSGIGLYNNLISTLCDSNRLDEAKLLIDEMKRVGLAPNQYTHNCVFRCLCSRQDVVGAKTMVRQMRLSGHEPWIKHSTLLIKQLCDNSRVPEACDFLTEMVQQGFVPDIVVYSAALRGLIKMGKLDDAIELFQNLCKHGRIPDIVAYNILISGLCKADRVSEADVFFNEMQKLGLVPSVVTYNLMILGWCKKGDIVNATLCLSQMIDQKTKPNVVTYTTLVDGLCIAGKPDEAIAVWEEMGKNGCDPTDVSFMAIIYGLCNCGRPNEALQYLRNMTDKDMKPQTYVYVALVKAFVDKQSFDSALQMLKELGKNGRFPGPGEKDHITLRDAIVKLTGNDETSSGIRELIAACTIPSVSVLDEHSK